MLDSAPIQIILFFSLLFLIYFVSKILLKSLGTLFYFLTRSHKKTVGLLAFLFLPGTIIHELAHVIVAGMMLVESSDIEFMPEIREDGVKLGSAQIHKTDPIRRTIIGVAPVLVGLGLIFSLSWYATSNALSLGLWTLFFYLIFIISNTMFSSKKDMEGTLMVFAILFAILVAFYYVGLLDFNAIFSSPWGQTMVEVLKKANLFLSLPLIIDLVILGFIKLSIKRIR